ncbi:uncharacterized protein EV154DRAFT_527837 [Mucor mucedo]|uniref:uncharacterized protein n=1 Tax=Mucor mucedo TaxID=29922 RepID=UPI002220736D|nr:uncharacterized protein EV154DRAFT_527837 [Mucor mucedo]KAI7873610.1 hypothetical protein EV154DRAFT_527837 [Mucor mucedo]
MSGNIKVVVRCRPLNAREKARGATSIIRMDGNQTIITNNKKSTSASHHQTSSRKAAVEDDQVKAFTFDRSYWSADKADDHYADQELVYNDMGRELLDHAFDGYNCCIFAYGQTGSGKSYSMMGYGEDKGIIPRTCSELFERISDLTSELLKFQVEVSYIEIYNEKVRDLLNPGNKGNLKVREHPTIGPYVEDLSRLVVNSFEDIDHLMNEGNKARTVAATNMNETSSRSHAVFTLFLTSNRFDETAKLNTEKCARISLVDLAGSERANSTGATGVRLKEGANINKSLTTLGKVIAALAESSAHPSTGNKKASALNPNFVPYRDSVLTWLLKDSLGGNSKTAMIAAISPADYDETMSTLRYADQAKRIKNKAIVNEDPNARLIRELKEELQALRDTLMIYAPEEVEKIIQQKKARASGTSSRASSRAAAAARATSTSPMLLISPESPIATQRGNSLLTKEQVIDQLQSSEKLLSEVKQTWEEKMNRTEEIHRQREKALAELGVIVEKDNMVGVYAPKTIHLINLNEDPLMTECLMYQIKSGITRVGRIGSAIADIRLTGAEILDEHCYFQNEKEDEETRVVTIYPGKDSVTLVNGMQILQPKVLHSGYRIIFGSGLHHMFRFNNPEEVRKEREQQLRICTSPDSALGSIMSPSSTTTTDILDWKFAHNEAVKKYGVTNASDLAVMTDEDLKQLSDGITKVREFRNRKRISSDCHNQLFSEDPAEVSPRTSISSSSNKRFSGVSAATTLLTEEDDEEDKRFLLPPPTVQDNEKLIQKATEEIQQQMELQKKEYEEKLRLVESSNMKTDDINTERDDLAAKYALVKQEMEKSLEQQRIAYENKIRRISAHLPPGTALSSDNLLVGFTSKNAAQHLLRQAVDKWRELKYVKMAEDCLIHAVVLKEANIMAKELGKNIVYQFMVVHDDLSANSLSFWESTSALQPFTREPDTHLMNETKPCVAVQVIDHVHRATYIWSIAKLKHRIRRMRRLYDYTDGPLFTGQHFNREDPFYETPCPRFSSIGLARVPLRNLTLQLHADNYVDVYCRNTGKVMGQVRVLITPIARSVSRKQQSARPNLNMIRPKSGMEQQGEKYLLHIGQQQVFEIRIQELRGVDESDFTQVHAQFRLSSFGNVERYSTPDKIYQTDPISNFQHGHIVFGQCQTLSVNITENMMDVILNQGLTIEVYGQAQPNYLYGLVEHAINNNIVPASRRVSIDRRFSLEKCTFDGILMEERHDVLAWIQICELNDDGQYVPVQVINSYDNKQHQDVFCLRQGLQRRIAFTLGHDSGRQFEWLDINNAKIGNVRLVDAKGRVTESPAHEAVQIQLFTTQQQIAFERNGTSRITAQGPWDSSLHDSLFLNRVTASGQRIRLTLSWQMNCDKCVSPLCFDMDICVQIGAMMSSSTSSSSMFRQLLLGSAPNSVSMSNKSSGMFIVQLKPPMTRQVRELWRLNTANKYVRGEEFIGSWKPRGVSLITDYRTARRRMLHKESVAAFRHALVLAGHPQTKVIQRSQSEMFTLSQALEEEKEEKKNVKSDPEALTRKVIDLWKTQFGTREEIVFNQDPPSINALTTSTSTSSLNTISSNKKYSKIKLTADIQQLHPSDTVTKRGYLLHSENVDDTWLKHWFVLRRPFIIIYEDQNEIEELGVFNLTSARVDYKTDLEEMLQRKYTFAIYTNNNAYLLQASDFEDMKDWMSKIDQFYPVDTLVIA